MKLISLNIEQNLHYKTVLDFIKKENPDVVCLQEVLEDDFEFLKKELNLDGFFKPWVYVNYEHYKLLKGKKFGNAIFSKNIIESGYCFHFGKEENILSSFENYFSNEKLRQNNIFIWVNIKNSDGEIYKFITTQLPVTHEGESTPYQLKVIDALIEKLQDCGEFVLCGDMNSPRGSESFGRLVKKYKDNIPIEYKTSIDQNLHRTKGIQFVVDCVFTTPKYQASDVRLVDGISDHMAIVADILKE